MGVYDQQLRQRQPAYNRVIRQCTEKEDLKSWEERLNMFSESVFSYIKGGNQAPVLIDFANIENDIEIELRNNIQRFISEKQNEIKSLMEKKAEQWKLYAHNDEKSEESSYDPLQSPFGEDFYVVVFEKIRENYETAMREADMYARFSELYRLYHKEEDERHIIEVFRRDCDEHKELLTVIKLLIERQDMTLKEMEESVFEKNNLESVINRCRKYFNIRFLMGETHISLNAKGRMLGEKAFKDADDSDRLYCNLNNVLEALEKGEALELTGLKPSHEKLIRRKLDDYRIKSQTESIRMQYWHSPKTSIVIESADQGEILNGRKTFTI